MGKSMAMNIGRANACETPAWSIYLIPIMPSLAAEGEQLIVQGFRNGIERAGC
jgi:hypothetical protein